MTAKWRAKKDPLFRGDGEGGVQVPVSAAAPSIVRHILYLDGAGRESPYLSTSEDHDLADYFAGSHGVVYHCYAHACAEHGVAHRSKTELIQLLTGRGKGDAKWSNAFEVLQARRYVEEWKEHLLDFRGVKRDCDAVVQALFERGRP